MNAVVIAFEQRVGLGPTAAARLLGVAYPTYAHYRSGYRDLPLYHLVHMGHIVKYNAKQLSEAIEESHGRSN